MTSQTLPSKNPGLPVPKDLLGDLYTLWYMERPPHMVSKYFRFNGDLKDAVSKAKSYCDQFRFRFILVRPFLTDLDREIRVDRQEPLEV